MTDIRRFPWHESLWQGLGQAVSQNRLAHALLLAGLPGLGKRLFAAQLAQSLLCATPVALLQPCGRCHACHTVLAGTHPDLVQLGLSEDSKIIKVEDLREFTRRLYLTSEQAQGKVGIIDPADAMNMSASNALLKTLEEPPSGSHILLIADRPMLLPATIRSRCQLLRFSPPEPAVALSWLNLRGGAAHSELSHAHGAPLLAAAMAEQDMPERRRQWQADLDSMCRGRASPLSIAEHWDKKDDLPVLLGWLQGWIADMAKLRLGASTDSLTNTTYADSLQTYAHAVSIQGLMGLSVALIEAKRLMDRQVSRQLVLENLLVSWYQECRLVNKTG